MAQFQLENNIDHSINWDWENAHVSNSFINATGAPAGREISINDIVEAGTVLIAAGPADLNAAVKANAGFRIVPIGLIETAQISMNKPLSRIFEIGSKLSYIIPGRTVGGISISRVFFDGPSLLKVIYMGEISNDRASIDKKFATFVSGTSAELGIESNPESEFDHISSGNVAMNLASSFFDQPVGLAFLFKDQQKDQVGQIYFEGCRVSTYNMGISAQMNVLTEAISMEFVRCRPIVTVPTTQYDSSSATAALADVNIVSALGV